MTIKTENVSVQATLGPGHIKSMAKFWPEPALNVSDWFIRVMQAKVCEHAAEEAKKSAAAIILEGQG